MLSIMRRDSVTDTVAAPYLDDGFRDLKRQTGSVLKTASVFIGSLVGPTPQKLIQQIAIGSMDFYTIETCGFCVLCCLPELLDDVRNLVGIQDPGNRNWLFFHRVYG